MCAVRAFSGKCPPNLSFSLRWNNILLFLTGLQVISGLWLLVDPAPA